MRRTQQLQGLRMLKLRDVLSRWESGVLSQAEAAEILGMSQRTFRRWSRRYEADGEEGLIAPVPLSCGLGHPIRLGPADREQPFAPCAFERLGGTCASIGRLRCTPSGELRRII